MAGRHLFNCDTCKDTRLMVDDEYTIIECLCVARDKLRDPFASLTHEQKMRIIAKLSDEIDSDINEEIAKTSVKRRKKTVESDSLVMDRIL